MIFAVLEDGAFAFENLNDDGRSNHLLDEFTEEGAFLVDAIEAFGLFAGHVDLLQGDRAQAVLFELGDDLADQVTTDGIGLDDGEGTFDRHGGRS
jgi:hypothetical protein